MLLEALRRSRAYLRLLAGRGTPILLHHANFKVPPQREERLHNVRPEVLRDQLRWLRRYLDFVTVDELVEQPDRSGYAAITFDDGYRTVLETALPVLADLGLPATVFVNGATLRGGPMWRQKVRRVIHRGWVDEWESESRHTRRIPGKSFYSYTKDPVNDSSVVEAELDAFLEARGETVGSDGLWLLASDLTPRPGVTWGNHGENHFVMSSLSRSSQEQEIDRTDRLLDTLPGIGRSRVFSLPFGARRQMNGDTIEILSERGYRGVLLCRSRLTPRRPESVGGLVVLDRFMPEEEGMLGCLASLDLAEGA